MKAILHVVAIFGLLTGIAGGVAAQDAPPIALRPMPYSKDPGFIGGKDEPATDISGMACMPAASGKRVCMVINDENRNAQFATIENGRLQAGEPIKLFGDKPHPEPVGRPPDIACPSKGKFEDLDGEGVGYAEPYFYVTGSHGCSRYSKELRLSAFLLARVRVDREGRPVDRNGKPVASGESEDAVETTWRVSDLLAHSDRASPFLAKDLRAANGLNIEGIAVAGDTVWFGLRAPVDHGDAFLIRGSASDLFRPDHDRAKVFYETIAIKLDGRGIRDLAILPDGRLLVLAGAPEGPEVPFELFVVDPSSKEVKPIGTLQAVEGEVEGKAKVGKAEAVTVLDETSNGVSVVVMFDSLLNGAPHRAEIAIPK